MIFSTREQIEALTPEWKGERSGDGRPKVPDRYLDALSELTLEEIWKPLYTKGYTHQFIAIKSLHPEFPGSGEPARKLIGRAVTAVYAPSRPDYYSAMMAEAASLGYSGTPNQWVLDSLRERDVIVVDMFDKIFKGTFVGGNLTTALRTRTVSGGAVIWGGIRDVEQMMKIPEVQVYYRGIDPTPIREFVMTGMNVPARLGDGADAAICLPGDVVFGCGGGVLFIPPQLIPEIVDGANKTRIKDMFGFEMISAGIYTTADIDRNVWPRKMLDELMNYIGREDSAAGFRGLDWNDEYKLAEEDADTQSAL